MNKPERRIITGGQIRSRKGGDKPGIQGYAAVYGKRSVDLGGFREVIRKGAFARMIKEGQDVRALFNHSADLLLGRVASRTLTLSEDDTGLAFDCDLPDTATGRDVQALVDRGDLDGCSFSFTIPNRDAGQEWTESQDENGDFCMLREVIDCDVYDVGPVTFPAYPQTSVDSRQLWPNGIPEDVERHLSERTAAAARLAAEKQAEIPTQSERDRLRMKLELAMR